MLSLTSRRLLLLALIALPFAGCGGPKYKGLNLSGTVKVGGQPVEQGTIQFAPIDQSGAVVSAEIKNGSYTTPDPVPVGKVKVLFIASKKTGKTKEEAGRSFEETVSIIADKYKDGLEKDITEGNTKLDFELDAQ